MCYNIDGDNMKTDYINVRVNKETKEKVEIVLDKLNLKMSDAINLFLNQVVLDEALPFKVRIPKYEEAYNKLEKAIGYNSFGGGVPSDYAKNILLLYAKGEIDFETAVFALNRER